MTKELQRPASTLLRLIIGICVGSFALGLAGQLQGQPQITIEQLAALQAVHPSQLPKAGTFWILGHPAGNRLAGQMAPLPVMPPDLLELGVPVFSLDDTHYLVDARSVDWEALEKAREVRSALASLEMELLGDSILRADWESVGQDRDDAPDGLWLETTAVRFSEESVEFILHGTSADVLYGIQSRESLDPTNGWLDEEPAFWGAAGQDWTAVEVSLSNRMSSAFFFRAMDYTGDPDNDGLPNWWEARHGLDPNDPTSLAGTADGDGDMDGDGYANVEEFMLGQDPAVADPPRPTITIAATDADAGEPSNSGVVTLSRSGVTTRPLTVYFKCLGRARSGFDFEPLGDEVTFAIGQSSVPLYILPIDDERYEGSEEVTVQLSVGLDYIPAETDSATVTIADNEVPPVKVAASYMPVVEGSGTNGVFRFYRSGDLRAPLTLYFSLTGTAANGVVFHTLPMSIRFETESVETNLVVTAINDTAYFGETACILTLLPHASYRIEANVGAATLLFQDNDLPVVSIVATDPDAREAGRNPGRATVTRTGATHEPLIVFYRVGGVARMVSPTVLTNDYAQLNNYVTIAAGQSTGFIDIVPEQDLSPEPMEQVVLTLAGGPGYTIGDPNRAVINIDDDDALTYTVKVRQPSIYDPDLDVAKYGGVIEVTRTGSALGSLYVPFTVTDTSGTALPSSQYYKQGDVLNSQLEFEPNQSTAVVKLLHRNTALSLMQLRFLTNIAEVPCWGRERLVRFGYIQPDYAVEGDPTIKARFWLERAASTAPLTVWLRLDGTATPGVDYPINTLLPVTFNTGVQSLPVEVYASPDSVSEGWESLIMRFDNSDLSFRPYNPNESEDARQETHAFLWLAEGATQGTPRPMADADGDLLSDSFETQYRFNALVPDDFDSDADKDGLSALEEQLAGTSPAQPDTDGDGVNDYRELLQGTSPTNALDFAPTGPTVAAGCLVGDQSTSHSETWQLQVGPFTINNTTPGTVIGREILLKQGESYTVRLRHLTSTEDPPDLDYYADVTSTDSAPPLFFVQDPQHLLGSHEDPGDGPLYSNKTTTIRVPRVEVSWTHKGDNLPLDTHTNAIDNAVMGNRIFVGAKSPLESDPRNTVLLKIKTTPPLAGSNVWLRAFDVDDTTTDSFDSDRVIDANGRSGGDNFTDYLLTPGTGVFVSSGRATNVVTLNGSGEAQVEFRVGMQPGNNYRIGVSVFPGNNLAALQSTDATGNGYVSAYVDKVRTGFNGVLSPLLTVWRKLHLEFDSMEAVPASGPEANFRTATIATARANVPKTGQSIVFLKPGPTSGIPDNELENGSLTVETSHSPISGNYVMGSTIPGSFGGMTYQNGIVVQGAVPSSSVNKTCTLRDDDDRFLTTIGLPPALPKDGESTNIVTGIRSVFLPAYIEVVNANAMGWNLRRRIAFNLNQTPGPAGGPFTDAKDIADSHLFWAHTVVFGYQPETASDMDPGNEGPAFGDTRKQSIFANPGISAIYVEMMREANDEYMRDRINQPGFYPDMRNDYYRWLFGITAHETAHYPERQSPGEDHDEDGLMHAEGQALTGFRAPSIRRFRQVQSWSD